MSHPLPARVERLADPARPAGDRRIDPRRQALAVGDRVPDYGGRDETLEVAAIDPPRALVYRSDRRGATFSRALLLEPEGAAATVLRLRFVGAPRSSGLRRTLLVGAGDFFDRTTGELMLRGLAERVRG